MENSSGGLSTVKAELLENEEEATCSLPLSSAHSIKTSKNTSSHSTSTTLESSNLQFDSPNFDPSIALFSASSAQIQLPVPDAPIFNNLSEYVNKTLGSRSKKASEDPALLKEKAEKLAADCEAPIVRLAKRKRAEDPGTSSEASSSSSGQVGSDSKEPVQDEVRRASRRNISIFDKMSECSYGPYSILHSSVNCRINVMIRRRKKCPTKGERFSNIDGTLVAFDKHFNILLTDARECYEHSIPKSDKIVKIVRPAGQMMIRGDNVIIVSKL